jgi:hypothetical protein
LVFLNGADDSSYQALDLDGQSTDADGYFVLCGDAGKVANCDLDVSPSTSLFQNGADAVGLYIGDAAEFPNDTPATDKNLVDAIVYDTNDSDDIYLVSVLLNSGQPQINECDGGDCAAHSNQRCPNGSGGRRNTDTYDQFIPTPGEENICDDPPTVAITTPANGTTEVAPDADIGIEFSEDVTVTNAWFDITCEDSGKHSADFSGGPQSYILNPYEIFSDSEQCTVTIYAAKVADQDGMAHHMASDYTFGFTIRQPTSKPLPLPPKIKEIKVLNRG